MIRHLLAADVPHAMSLVEQAGWNQTADDWLRLIELEPDGCLAFDQGGQIVATTTIVCYGTELAWIGMVLTDPEWRRRGFARQLMERALEMAECRRVRTVKLDATVDGRPLYSSLGFRDEQPIERWRRGPLSTLAPGPDLRVNPDLDHEAMGADRSALLRALDYRVERPGRVAHYFGPFLSRDPGQAEAAILAATGAIGGECFWDLLPDHAHASRIARQLGFAPVRRLTRMLRGLELRHRDDLIYAIGGFEVG